MLSYLHSKSLMPIREKVIFLRKLKRGPKHWAGFTLVELLVTIAIIAILLTLVFAAYGPSMEASRNAICQGNLKKIAAASFAYAADHHTVPPTGRQTTGGVAYWFQQLAPYLGGAEGLTPGEASRQIEAYWCPSAHAQHTPGEIENNNRILTYGVNSGVVQARASSSGGRVVYPAMKPVVATSPAKTAFYMDGHLSNPEAPFWDWVVRPHQWVAEDSIERNFVHQGQRVNVVFLDGHVESLAVPNIPTDSSDIFWNPNGIETDSRPE